MSSVEPAVEPMVICGVSLDEAWPADLRWRQRTVRVLEAGSSRRAMLARLARSIQSGCSSLWDRGVYLLSPTRSRRAEALVRQGIEATDRALADLLGALAPDDHSALSVDGVRAAIDAVREAGEPVLHHAADASPAYDALLRARLPFQFKKLGLAQLDRIREGLQACVRSGRVDAWHLALIEAVLEQVAAPRQRRVDALVEAARHLIAAPLLEAEAASEGEAVALIEEMYATAAGLMRAHDLAAEDRRTQCRLIMQGIRAHINADRGLEGERGAQYARILALMPDAQRHALHETGAQAPAGSPP